MKRTAIRCNDLSLGSLLDGSLDAEDLDRIEVHIEGCDKCRLELESIDGATDSRSCEIGDFLIDDEYDQENFTRTSLSNSVSSVLSSDIQVDELDGMVAQVIDRLAPTDEPENLGRLEAYEVTGIVGLGAMGVVLKAHDPSLDRIIAIKVMAPYLAWSSAGRRRFLRESKAAAAVIHPNLIPIYSVSSDRDLPFLVMPYIRGMSLQKRIETNGPLPLQEILRIGSQAAAGLAAAHQHGLIHCDVKPANILLEEGIERVAITDFGLARAADDVSLTQSGVISGTPQYMSPEQARGQRLSPQSDLFSLGSVMYAMCIGHSPFRAETSHGSLHRVINDTPRPVAEVNPDIPLWFSDLIETLHAKEPDQRIASAEDLEGILRECIAHVEQPQQNPLPSGLRSTRPNRLSFNIKHVFPLLFVAIVLSLFALTDFNPSAASRTDEQDAQAPDPSDLDLSKLANDNRSSLDVVLVQGDLSDAEKTMTIYDRNDDGFIDSHERTRLPWHDEFSAYDLNNDRKLTHLEIAVRQAKGRGEFDITQFDIGNAKRIVRRRDLNNNGQLDPSEVSSEWLSEPESYDYNSDGVITQFEYARRLAFKRAFKRELGIEAVDNMNAVRTLDRFDTNRNHRLDTEELESVDLPGDLETEDRDGDGSLDHIELALLFSQDRRKLGMSKSDAAQVQRIMSMGDQDRDGRLSEIELARISGFATEQGATDFQSYDRNKDGEVTLLEIKQAIADKRKDVGFNDSQLEEAKRLMLRFDANRTTHLESEDLEHATGIINKTILPSADRDEDGRISLTELARFLAELQEPVPTYPADPSTFH